MDSTLTAPFTIEHCRKQIDNQLRACQPFSPTKRLDAAIAYALFAGGKRLRALLVLGMAESLGKVTPAHMQLASAIEMVHIASVVLDDTPAMDNADTRRGAAPLHEAFDAATAILVSHSLTALAQKTVLQLEIPDAQRIRIGSRLAHTIGAHGMAGGQSLDLQGIGTTPPTDDLLKIAYQKTGILFETAALCAALIAEESPEREQAAAACGAHLGIAYQIADDLLDVHTEDRPETSVNIVQAVGEENARELFATEMESVRDAMETLAGASSLLQELTTMVEQHAD